MADKPKALRLADVLNHKLGGAADEDIEQAASELRRLAAVEAERDALRVDAERYRCWRENFANDEPDDPNDLNPLLAALTDAWTEDEIDAAIDATIAEKGGGNG